MTEYTLDINRYLSDRNKEIDEEFLKFVDRYLPSIEHPCDNGCQYAKDVGMPEHSCMVCMYEKHNRFEKLVEDHEIIL